MTLVRSLPARPAYSPQSEITRLFNSFFDSATPLAAAFGQPTRRFVPAIDVVEKDGEFLLHADLPGLSDGDVKVEILDGAEAVVRRLGGERAPGMLGINLASNGDSLDPVSPSVASVAPVLFQCLIRADSCGLSLIEVQQATEPFTATDAAVAGCDGNGITFPRPWWWRSAW